MLALLIQTLNITAPVFAMLFMGVLLKRIHLIDDNFNRVASQLVFNVCMPALLFLGIYHADLAAAVKPGVILYFIAATLVGFAVAWGMAIWRSPLADRGIYTQGAFRGNNGVIGLALAASLYGDYGISLGAVLAGLVILMYNSLSAVVLAVYSPDLKSDPWSICKSIFSNPLIISVLVATPMAYGQVPLPNWLLTSGDDPAVGLDVYWRHPVADGIARQRQAGHRRQPGEDGLATAGRHPRRLAVWFSRGRTGHPVPVHRQPYRSSQLRHGASSQWQP